MSPVVIFLFLVTLFTGLALGARLLWLHHRTHGTPELVMGVAALCTCLSGLVRGALLNLGEGAPAVSVFALQVLFNGLYVAAPIGMVLGTWRVFRPDATWARSLALGISLVLAATVPARFLMENGGATDSPRAVTMMVAATIVSIWTAIEAFVHWGKLRKRMRLGLADPVSAFQFLAWGCAMTSNTVTRTVTLFVVGLTGVEPLRSQAFMLPSAVLGFLTLSGMYLAFFPPLALQDRLQSGAEPARPGA